MQTNFPTVDIYFVFAYTFCRLRVYKTEEGFARKILASAGVEMMEGTESSSWTEWDTRVLLGVISNTLPQLVKNVIPKREDIAKAILEDPAKG
jgi:hypothetical protein